MAIYTFNKTDNGYQGKAFEMAIKSLLDAKHPDRVSPCGQTDLRYNGKCYDVKQNGSPIQYNPKQKMIKGSTRVIYTTHIVYDIITETETEITISVDLDRTEFFVLDRDKFVEFLLENGLAKENKSRGTVNIQTLFVYKTNKYHGAKWKKITAYGRANNLGLD